MAIENRYFPHLLPKDIEVWKRFLEAHAKEYDYFEYDVRVGEGRDPGPEHTNTIRSMAIGLSQRRIDAIGYRKDRATIFEITTSAGLTAVGQLQVYPQLLKMLHPTQTMEPPILIAERIQDDILPYLQQHNIKYILFP